MCPARGHGDRTAFRIIRSCSQIHVHGGPRYLVSLRLLLVESQSTAAICTIRRCAAQDEAHFLTQSPVHRSVPDPECAGTRLTPKSSYLPTTYIIEECN
jgi:hypothetical protein